MFSQERFTREYYLLKSKKQKSAGFAFVVIGGAVAGIGLIVAASESASFYDDWWNRIEEPDYTLSNIITCVGLTSIAASLPFFIASSNNKARALKASASLKLEKFEMITVTTLRQKVYPALSVRVNF